MTTPCISIWFKACMCRLLKLVIFFIVLCMLLSAFFIFFFFFCLLHQLLSQLVTLQWRLWCLLKWPFFLWGFSFLLRHHNFPHFFLLISFYYCCPSWKIEREKRNIVVFDLKLSGSLEYNQQFIVWCAMQWCSSWASKHLKMGQNNCL